MKVELPRLHINQQSIADSKARFRVVMCGRRFGKSELSQVEIICSALQGNRVAYITPTYSLARYFFDRLTQRLGFPNNKSELIMKFPNGGVVEFYTGERLDNLRGRKFNLAVIDEASYIPDLEKGWLNAIRPTLTDFKGKALFISTPKGKNYFYSLFMNGLNKNEDWESFKFSTYDNPFIDKTEIDDARKMLPEVAFEQEYLANPSENSANPFGYSYIKQCTYPLSDNLPVCYGIDLAKSYDYTVIIGLDKFGSVCYYDRFQKDWKQTKEAILSLYRAPALIDSTGVGDPIFEDLVREGMAVTGFKISSTSKQQIMEGLASAIQQRKITFPDGPIVKELEIFEFQYTQNGVKYCVSLDTMILTSNLKWVKAEDITIGENLIGFDEFHNSVNLRREFKNSIVLSHEIIKKPCYKIILENGDELISSEDHKWLVDIGNVSNKNIGKLEWIDTNKLRGINTTNSNRYSPHKIVKPFEINKHLDTYESGYLSGVFDGEGNLQCIERKDHYGYNLRLGFAQNQNELLEYAIKILDKLNINYNIYKKSNKINKCVSVYIVGGRKEIIKVLSILQPKRLINKFNPDKLGQFDKGQSIKIKTIEFIGIQDVVAMSTTTKTFIANGYASHNCAPTGFHDDCVIALSLAYNHFTRNVGRGTYSFA